VIADRRADVYLFAEKKLATNKHEKARNKTIKFFVFFRVCSWQKSNA